MNQGIQKLKRALSLFIFNKVCIQLFTTLALVFFRDDTKLHECMKYSRFICDYFFPVFSKYTNALFETTKLKEFA